MGDGQNLAKTIEDTLRAVMETLIDGEEGFRLIGHDLKDESLRVSFLAESERRAGFRKTLEETLHQIGVENAKESGTVIGALHRSWGDFKAKLGGSDRDLIETAIQGEGAAVHFYKQALEKQTLLPIRNVLINQQAHIEETLEYLHAAADEFIERSPSE